MKVSVITPGLVLIKNALSEDEARDLKRSFVEPNASGFWCEKDGMQMLNSGTHRGRIFQALDQYAGFAEARKCCTRAVALAQQHDDSMPDHVCTHLLMLRYESSSVAEDTAMYWHRDVGENDGDTEAPVVSMNLGCSALFGYKLWGRPEQQILLEHGDVLLFGGAQRKIEHCVHTVIKDSAPDWWEEQHVRYNLTWREAPSILGEEHKYKVFVEVDNAQLLDGINR